MDRLHNPFTPGAGALPPELAGRAAAIEDGRVLAGRTMLGRYEKSLMLIGLRGVGKTVLLKHLAESATGHAVPIVEIAKRMGRPVTALSPQRASLIRKGMLCSPAHGTIAYTVPLFGAYMRRVMP